MDKLFREKAKTIRIYMATETIVDPFEKNVELTDLNPLPIKAIVTDLIASQIQWKMPGIVTEKAKEIIIKKKYRSLIEKSQKLDVGDAIISHEGGITRKVVEFYEGWKVNGRMQIREEQDFLRILIYKKKVSE